MEALIQLVDNPDIYFSLKPSKEVKNIFDLVMRKPIIPFISKSRLESLNYIKPRVAGKSWFDKYQLSPQSKPKPLAPYYRLYKVSPPDPTHVTDRTGALVAGLKEGITDDWLNVSGTRSLWETGKSYKTLKGTIRGKLSDGITNVRLSSKNTVDQGSSALDAMRKAYAYWGWKPPEDNTVLQHFRHESRGARGGRKRPYIAKAMTTTMPELERELRKAWDIFLIKWLEAK